MARQKRKRSDDWDWMALDRAKQGRALGMQGSDDPSAREGGVEAPMRKIHRQHHGEQLEARKINLYRYPPFDEESKKEVISAAEARHTKSGKKC